MSTRSIWGFNTKDVFEGTISSAPTMFGRRRSTPIDDSLSRVAVACGLRTKRFVGTLLFRRVRPVESRTYAFSRNVFAVIAMVILVFRTITALLQAQNEIGTRITSGACEGRVPPYYTLGILVERLTYASFWDLGGTGHEDVDIAISVTPTGSRRGQHGPHFTVNCTSQWSKDYGPITFTDTLAHQYRRAELYACPESWAHSSYNFLGQGEGGFILVYDIEVRSRAPGGIILPGQTPQIWLLDSREIPPNINSSDIAREDFEIREYSPSWELQPGSHINAEAKLITRRFINSSIMKDIVLNSEPNYRSLSLFPIVESSVTPINSSIATAKVSASFTPGLVYLRTESDVRRGNSVVCDFVDDYRSGTILDVVGSVGGLFALLQAVHLLLFGAKLITPFGLVGNWSSREFKRRLRDEYHTSAEDGSDTIHIVKFLRDFVIEFGPADLEPERCSSQELLPLEVKEDSSDPRVSLMQMGPVATLVRQRDEDSGEDVERRAARASTL